jgi:hypothetical protein
MFRHPWLHKFSESHSPARRYLFVGRRQLVRPQKKAAHYKHNKTGNQVYLTANMASG